MRVRERVDPIERLEDDHREEVEDHGVRRGDQYQIGFRPQLGLRDEGEDDQRKRERVRPEIHGGQGKARENWERIHVGDGDVRHDVRHEEEPNTRQRLAEILRAECLGQDLHARKGRLRRVAHSTPCFT